MKEPTKSDQLRAFREGKYSGVQEVKSSDGGVEGHAATSGVAGRTGKQISQRASIHPVKARPSEYRENTQPVGVESGPSEARPKGRPLEKDRPMSLAQTRPWVSLGMSRRTYYRRKAEGKL